MPSRMGISVQTTGMRLPVVRWTFRSSRDPIFRTRTLARFEQVASARGRATNSSAWRKGPMGEEIRYPTEPVVYWSPPEAGFGRGR